MENQAILANPSGLSAYAVLRGEILGWRQLQCEEARSRPPERWLQQIWRHQRLHAGPLVLADGRRLKVWHPGFWNREPGPDFRKAVIQIGDEPARTGDVEVDLESNGWVHHGHDTNPSYSEVLLHVVWNKPEGKSTERPTLWLGPILDEPLPRMLAWLTEEAAGRIPTHVPGDCCHPLQSISSERIETILRDAAEVRLAHKAREMAGRAGQVGWDRALLENLTGALGYKKNMWPMRRVGEAIWKADRSSGLTAAMARCFGVAGFLAESGMGPANRGYIRGLWDEWWRERNQYEEDVLPANAWVFGGFRPLNHPQRRLALAAHWTLEDRWVDRMMAWVLEERRPQAALASLGQILGTGIVDPFWSRHWTLTGGRINPGQPLIGEARTVDLAMNVILPWVWGRSAGAHDGKIRSRVLDRYRSLPGGEDNTVLRLARERLFGGRYPRLPKTAAMQQGMLQVVRDFCDHSNAICQDCRFPELVRSIR